MPSLTTVPVHTGLNETSSVHPGLRRLQDSPPAGEGHRQPPVFQSHPEPLRRGPTTEWPWPGISMRGIQLQEDLAGPSPGRETSPGCQEGWGPRAGPTDPSPDRGLGWEADPARSGAGPGGGGQGLFPAQPGSTGNLGGQRGLPGGPAHGVRTPHACPTNQGGHRAPRLCPLSPQLQTRVSAPHGGPATSPLSTAMRMTSREPATTSLQPSARTHRPPSASSYGAGPAGTSPGSLWSWGPLWSPCRRQSSP